MSTLFEHAEKDPPKQVLIAEMTERQGGTLDGDRLLLSDKTVKGIIPLQGVVIREYVMTCLPQRVSSSVREMIANSVATFLLRGTKREDWCREVLAPDVQIRCCRPRGGSRHEDWLLRCFSTIIAETVEAVKSGVAIGADEYRRIAKRISEKYTPSLDANEISLLRRLLRSPIPSLRTIADEMGKSIQWVSKKSGELEEIEVIRRCVVVNLWSLGIREFTVIYLTDDWDNLRAIAKRLNEFPFTYRIEEGAPGGGCLIASLRVPDARTNIEAVKTLIESLSDFGETHLQEPVAIGHSEDLKFYDIETGRWRVPWDLAKIEFNRIHREALASVMPKTEADMALTSKYLTRFDLRVLQCVLEGATRIGDIRQTLHVGQARVAASYRKLRDEGIITDVVELLHIGLYERAIITAEDPEIADSIVAWSQTLPKVEHRRWLNNGMEMRLQLPRGGTQGVLEALDEVLQDISVLVRHTQTERPFILPVKEWNEETQKWKTSSVASDDREHTHQ